MDFYFPSFSSACFLNKKSPAYVHSLCKFDNSPFFPFRDVSSFLLASVKVVCYIEICCCCFYFFFDCAGRLESSFCISIFRGRDIELWWIALYGVIDFLHKEISQVSFLLLTATEFRKDTCAGGRM